MSKYFVLSADSDLHKTLKQAAEQRRLVFFAGLPGVGKSLYLQQLNALAQQAGRSVHLLQWDVTRAAFELPKYLALYPEVDGVTSAAIRKAVGLWTRQAVWNWHQYYDDSHILIGEVPLVGNRLIELVQSLDDPVEALLASSQCEIILPVPSAKVRNHIEAARQASIDKPSHDREAYDAPPNVVVETWHTIYQLGLTLGFAHATNKAPEYDAQVYSDTYRYLLQHRQHTVLAINEVLPVSESVYQLEEVVSELAATPAQIDEMFSRLQQQYSEQQLEQAMQNWWHL